MIFIPQRSRITFKKNFKKVNKKLLQKIQKKNNQYVGKGKDF